MHNVVNDVVEGRIQAALEILGPAAGLRVEHLLRQVAQVAYGEGQRQALLSLRTADQVAEQYGITPRRIRAIAQRRGIGWQVPHTRQWLFTPEEADRLRPGRPGRPRP